MQFRPFEPRDIGHLATWLSAAGLGVPESHDAGPWWRRLVDDPHILGRVVVVAGEAVGFYRLDVGPDRAAELTVLVDRSHRRKGVGKRLLDRVLCESRELGLRRLIALVEPENQAALRFFRAGGFEPVAKPVPGFVHLERLVHSAGRHEAPLEIVV